MRVTIKSTCTETYKDIPKSITEGDILTYISVNGLTPVITDYEEPRVKHVEHE